MVLLKIESILTRNGRSLSEFSTIPFSNNNVSNLFVNRLLKEELSYNVDALKIEFNTMYFYLNEEQRIHVQKNYTLINK